MNIAILMTVHNRKDITLECIKALLNCKDFNIYNIDIYMVDDGSTDGTAQCIHQKYPFVTIINGDGNLFWNRGMHLCWTKALEKQYDFYIWLNNDTILTTDALVSLLDTYRKTNSNAIIVGSICSSMNKNQVTYGGRIKNKILPADGEIQKVETFNGNLVLIPAKVSNQIGIIDPYFHHSFGDIEYGLRATKNNIPIYMTPHYVGYCERHDQTMKCFNSHYKIKERFIFFYSPLGMNPKEFFYLNKKYKGIFIAIKTYISTHLRVIFPFLWK